MSIRQGNNIISSGNNKVFPLLHHDWFDYILNDLNWLRADTFTPYSGTIYKPVYNHLVADFDGTVATSETISGITITYYRATDGHKICLPDQEVNLTNLYNAIGIAWYYVLDIPNQTFKLPRSKYNTVTSIITNPGDYVEPTLPNITGRVSTLRVYEATSNGAFYTKNESVIIPAGTGSDGSKAVYMDASLSSSIYKDNATVQPPAVQKYLYFYIGNFTQNAIDTIANLNMEILNAKVNTGHEVIAYQAPTAENSYTWYRKYKDNWVEIGGLDTTGTAALHTIEIPVAMSVKRSGQVTTYTAATDAGTISTQFDPMTDDATHIRIGCRWGTTWSNAWLCWEVKGIAA
jgi:hypothetical protein